MKRAASCAAQPVSGLSRVFDTADFKTPTAAWTLLGLSADGQPVQAVNRGSKNYHWQIIRPRAKQATGDQRINSFGVGGEIEIRSGLLVQMQPITGPQMHFGLGEQTAWMSLASSGRMAPCAPNSR